MLFRSLRPPQVDRVFGDSEELTVLTAVPVRTGPEPLWQSRAEAQTAILAQNPHALPLGERGIRRGIVGERDETGGRAP